MWNVVVDKIEFIISLERLTLTLLAISAMILVYCLKAPKHYKATTHAHYL